MVEVLPTYSNRSKSRSKWYLTFLAQPLKLSEYASKLSVHIILFDGGSRYILKHQLPKTIKYLKTIKNKYAMFDMLKYHTIHHNSKPHFLPLFYGHRYNYTDKKANFYKIIFDDFKEEKYIVINSNLDCDIREEYHGENNYTGSDHNIIYPSCDKYYNMNKLTKNKRCLGDKQIHQHYFNYYKQALNYYHSKRQPVFSVTVLKDSHDQYLQSTPRVDLDLSIYLNYLNNKGILNNSVIIITADHGMHYGKYYKKPVLLFLLYSIVW